MIVLLYCFFFFFPSGGGGGYLSEVPDLMNPVRVFVSVCVRERERVCVPADVSSTAGVGSWVGCV